MIEQSLRVIDSDILFEFIESISNKSFDNTSEWGFVVKDMTDDMKHPRWAVVNVVGPKVKDVSVGDYILIENLQWTNKLSYKHYNFWKTNESKVIMVSKDRPKGFK